MKIGKYLIGALLLGAICLGAVAFWRHTDAVPPPAPDYADAAAWLCRPGRADACGMPMQSTVLELGHVRKATFVPNPTAGADCFYVYPTVSRARGAYGPIEVTAELSDIARRQLARFTSMCRPFAPVYRQVSLAGLRPLLRGDPRVTLAIPYADVLAAWRHYLSRDNGGRGIVLIGHSQGSRLLARLLATEIEGKPVQKQLVAAIIPGAIIDVPDGKDTGGTFKGIPLCGSPRQTGCVIAYSSFPADRPMSTKARFGAGSVAGMRDACVDPVQLAGTRRLDAVLPLPPELRARFGSDFADLPDAIGAACRREGRFSILALAPVPDTRLGEPIEALIERMAHYSAETGLHALDLELALATLVDIVGQKAAAMPPQAPVR